MLSVDGMRRRDPKWVPGPNASPITVRHSRLGVNVKKKASEKIKNHTVEFM